MRSIAALVALCACACAAADESDFELGGESLSTSDLFLPLLGARLAELAYAPSRIALEQGLAEVDMPLELVGSQGVEAEEPTAEALLSDPQWFMARTQWDKGALFVVLRGTRSVPDAVRALVAAPAAQRHNNCSWHGAVLEGARRATSLHALLRQELSAGASRDYTEVFVIGHALGGALALVLGGAGFVPRGGREEAGKPHAVSVLAFGAPPVGLGECARPAARQAAVRAFVHGADVLPRALGSSAALLGAALGSELEEALRDADAEALRDYALPEHAELVHLSARTAAATVCPQHRWRRLLQLQQRAAGAEHEQNVGYAEALGRARLAAAPLSDRDEL